MVSLNCKLCGGILEKDGNICVCQKCGETFKDFTDNIFSLQDYPNNVNNVMNMNYCSNIPKEKEQCITINCISDIIKNLKLLQRPDANQPFIVLEAPDGSWIQTMYKGENYGYIVEKSIETDIVDKATYKGSDLLNEQLVQRLFADFYTKTTTAISVQWEKVEY